jgi:cytochrome c oxidase cbb3-type subunit 2
MSRSSNIFAGLLGSFALSVCAMVLAPQKQLGNLEPNFTEEEGRFSDIYPVKNAAADQGRKVYVEQGCIYCHSQQIRDPQNGTDIRRGWGTRRTVARDYIFDEPALLGNSRLGPDLTNVGTKEWRNEPKGDTQKPAKRDAAWHLLHLYAPRSINADSNHPSYRFLFDEKPLTGDPASDSLKLTGADAPPEGKQIIPNNDAKSLVTYLLTLDRSHPLPEASAAGANAPAASAAPATAPAPAAPAAAAPAAK